MLKLNHSYSHAINMDTATDVGDFFLSMARNMAERNNGAHRDTTVIDTPYQSAEKILQQWYKDGLKLSFKASEGFCSETTFVWRGSNPRTLEGIIFKSGDVLIDGASSISLNEGVMTIWFPDPSHIGDDGNPLGPHVQIQIMRTGGNYDVLARDAEIIAEALLKFKGDKEEQPKVFEFKNRDLLPGINWWETINQFNVRRILNNYEYWRLLFSFDKNGNVVARWNGEVERYLMQEVTTNLKDDYKRGEIQANIKNAVTNLKISQMSFNDVIDEYQRQLTKERGVDNSPRPKPVTVIA